MNLDSSFPLYVSQAHSQVAFAVPSRTPTSTHSVPSVLPPPTPQLPPAFFSSAVNQLNSLDSFSGGGLSTSTLTLDTLDDLPGIGGDAGVPYVGPPSVALDTLDGLDSLDDFLDTTPSTAAALNDSKAELEAGEKSLDDLLDELSPLETVPDPGGLSCDVPKLCVKAVDQLDSLDALDSFPSVDGVVAALPTVSIGGAGLDSLSDFGSTGN